MPVNDDAETERLRQLTPDERVRIANALWEQAWQAAAAGVRARHPDWSDAQIAAGVRELFRDAAS